MDAKTDPLLLAARDRRITTRSAARRRPPRLDVIVLSASVIVGVTVLWAIAPEGFAPYSTTHMDLSAILQPPSGAHPLGADHLGRDVLSLVIYGARQSLIIGAGSVAVGVVVGGLIGLLAGYVGGLADMAAMRLLEVWMSVPAILLVILIATALRPSVANVVMTIGLVSAPHYARMMRSQVMALKNRPFVEASRAVGASHPAILLRHILPHAMSPMLVLAILGVGTGILMGAALSFIGLGVIDDRPDWGFLLSQGRSYLTVAWWFGTFPGLAITALVISINLLGEALRHRLDPRSKVR